MGMHFGILPEAAQSQSPSNKALRWALFMKQNLRFGLVWASLGSLEFMNFYNYFGYECHYKPRLVYFLTQFLLRFIF